MKPNQSPFINTKKRTIEFFIQHPCADHISLMGSFNHWAKDELPLKPETDGVWSIEIPMLPHGKYHYKFIIDDRMLMEDIENQYREPDGVTGWNSVLNV